ncbi:hypothetical protein [Nocardia sp. NPDC020380]|uniref:hypothetical protein n=1 Tax=Nocardia sp. NPDC020380 TaxID=3364309 RepID=UPI0037923108
MATPNDMPVSNTPDDSPALVHTTESAKPTEGEKHFTQDHVSKILAKHRREIEARVARKHEALEKKAELADRYRNLADEVIPEFERMKAAEAEREKAEAREAEEKRIRAIAEKAGIPRELLGKSDESVEEMRERAEALRAYMDEKRRESQQRWESLNCPTHTMRGPSGPPPAPKDFLREALEDAVWRQR